MIVTWLVSAATIPIQVVHENIIHYELKKTQYYEFYSSNLKISLFLDLEILQIYIYIDCRNFIPFSLMKSFKVLTDSAQRIN